MITLTQLFTRGLLAPAILLLAACASTSDPEGSIASDLTDDQRLKIHFDNAWQFLESGNIDRATHQAEKALAIDPDNERATLIYARGRLMRGTKDDLIEAVAMCEGITEKNDWRVQDTWGAALERLGVLHEEAADAVKSGRRPTEAADPVARAAELDQIAREFLAEARTHFERAAELKTGEYGPMNGLMRVNALLGELDQSVLWGEKLLDALESRQRLNQNDLAQPGLTARTEDGLFEQQRSLLDLEIKTRLLLAEAAVRKDDFETAAKHYEAVIGIDPRQAAFHSLYAQALYKLGRYERARESLNNFLARRAEDPSTSFDSDPEVRRAYSLRNECEDKIARGSRE